MANKEQKFKKYIVVEVTERNHHLCALGCSSDIKYSSIANGRSRIRMANLCSILNKNHEVENGKS